MPASRIFALVAVILLVIAAVGVAIPLLGGKSDRPAVVAPRDPALDVPPPATETGIDPAIRDLMRGGWRGDARMQGGDARATAGGTVTLAVRFPERRIGTESSVVQIILPWRTMECRIESAARAANGDFTLTVHSPDNEAAEPGTAPVLWDLRMSGFTGAAATPEWRCQFVVSMPATARTAAMVVSGPLQWVADLDAAR